MSANTGIVDRSLKKTACSYIAAIWTWFISGSRRYKVARSDRGRTTESPLFSKLLDDLGGPPAAVFLLDTGVKRNRFSSGVLLARL